MNYEDHACHFPCGDDLLYGILSVPDLAQSRGILMLVGGSQYRAGSHRQFTLLSRFFASRGIPVRGYELLFTISIAVVVTLAMNWVGLMVINSLLVLPAAAARNIAKNLRQYHLFSVLGALAAGILGLVTSYYLGSSTGAVISLYLALWFAVTFCLRKR